MAERDPEHLVQAVCDALVAAAPPGWHRVELKVLASVAMYQLELLVVMADGKTATVETPGLAGIVAELRSGMYEPGRGTWFSARFQVRAGEPPEAGFNYDQDPAWWPPVPPEQFARDLRAFPRTDEHIPDWLRNVLELAGTSVETGTPDGNLPPRAQEDSKR